MSGIEAILYAGYRLSREVGRDDFTATDLTVNAWRLCPARLGMKGFESKYPDHKAVMANVCGSMARKGLIERVRPSVYRLTSRGVRLAERVAVRRIQRTDGPRRTA